MTEHADDTANRSLELTGRARAAIVRALGRAGASEACGLLLGRPGPEATAVALAAVRCRNRARDPEASFVLDPGDWVRWDRFAARRGLAVIGVWHTHPRGGVEPSASDRAGAPAGLWSIVCAGRSSKYGADRAIKGNFLLWKPFRAPERFTECNGRERRTASSPSMGHTLGEAPASLPPLLRRAPVARSTLAHSLHTETPR